MIKSNNIIIKYIFYSILKPFFLITLILTGLVWLSRSLQYVDLIINKGLSLYSYFWFVALIAPKILSLLLPLISFAAILYTYQKLKSDSELLAMSSFGVSKLSLIFPALLFGLLIGLIVLFIEIIISPSNYKKFKSFQSDLRNSFAIASIQEKSFHSPMQDITVYIDQILPNGTVKNILIHDNRNKKIESTILAKKGIISNIEKKPNIIVFNGSRYLHYKNDIQTSILNFDRYEFKLEGIEDNKNENRFRQVEERSLKELFFSNNITDKRIKNEFYSEGHRRLSSPILVIFMSISAAFSILHGKIKEKISSRKVMFFSTIAVFVQALYILVLNNISFTKFNFFIPYLSLLILSFIPIILLKNEENLNKIKEI